MEFIKIEKTEFLSVDQMNNIFNDFLFLKEKFENEGLIIDGITTYTVDYNTSPAQILSIFNAVEQNIQVIHRALKEQSGENYKAFTWQPYTVDRHKEVWRWIDWLDDVKQLSVKWQSLIDSDDTEITDINDEIIEHIACIKE